MPLVTAVFAQSLDGRIALARAASSPADGAQPRERTVFSTDEGSIHAHRARAAHDAVLVGVGTVLADDPRLTVRLCTSDRPPPLRVVVDSAFATPPGARLVTGGEGGVVVIGAEGRADEGRRAALEARGVATCIVPASPDGRVDLAHALAALAARGARSVLVEGGSAILTSLFRARLVDAVEIDVAPVFLGAAGLAALGDVGIASLAGAARLEGVTVDRLGVNLLVRGRVVYGGERP